MTQGTLYLNTEHYVVKNETKDYKKFLLKRLQVIWFINLSIWLWFNSYVTPMIMIFPELNDKLLYGLWVNEVTWILEICRQTFLNKGEGKDNYASIVAYLKRGFILDIIATLPQVASNLNPTFNYLKNLRLY